MTEERAANILHILKEKLVMPKWTVSRQEPFETLIATIISQNTADTNTRRAFENLSKQFEITPQTLSQAETSKIEKCLHIAGLHKSKSKTIKNVSKIVLEKFGGSLKPILSLPLSESREKLMDLPGVGPKTADVVLLFSANQPTIPVDTHVNRVAKRLGLAPANCDYDMVRSSLQTIFDQKDYLNVHLLLIDHGRKYCKARRPNCIECPLNNFCPSKTLGDKK